MRMIFALSMVLTSLVLMIPKAEASDFTPCKDRHAFPEFRTSLCTEVQVLLGAPGNAVGGAPKTIHIFVRKFPANSPAKGTLWLISGGPGESGATFYPFIATLRKSFPDFDLLIPDHRGTGYSSRLCPKEEAIDSPGGAQLVGDEWATCWKSLNDAPDYARAFSITNAANDLATLIANYRSSKPVYVYAVSYGTQLILRTMLIHNPKIDGVILDSLVPPETTTQWDLSHRSDVANKIGLEILHRCDVDATCRSQVGGHAEDAYTHLLASIQPSMLDQIPGKDLKIFFGSLLDSPATRAEIPSLIAELNRGKTGTVDIVKRQIQSISDMIGRYPQSPPSIPLVSIISGSENDARPDLTAKQVASEQEHLLFATPIPALLVDSGLPLYPRDKYFGELPAHFPPTLVLQGTLDPKTPFDGAHIKVERMKGTGTITLIPVQDAPHFILLNAPDCLVEAVSSFQRRAKVQAPACTRAATRTLTQFHRSAGPS